jgi:hypothetical protein
MIESDTQSKVKSPQKADRTSRRGSALVWAMVLIMVLLILIGVMATVAQSSYNGQKMSQTNTQAYYTARSVNTLITDWLEGTPNNDAGIKTDRKKFVEDLKNSKNGIIEQSYTEKDLDPSGEGKMGYAEAVVSINSDDPDKDRRNTLITITATGHFAGASETITSMLRETPYTTFTYQNADMTPYGIRTFDPDAEYGQMERDLNDTGKHPRDANPVILGNVGGSDYADNTKDQTTVNNIIQNADSKREVTLRNKTQNFSTVLGTTRDPAYGAGGDSGKYDYRRLVTPENGRWTINPLQTGGYHNVNKQVNSVSNAENTRLISISMGDFRKMDVSIRFGGYALDRKDEKDDLINGTNYYNSLLMFDFVDNAGSTLNNPHVEYYEGNAAVGVSHLWHPQNWGSMTMYTQKTDDPAVNGGVNARLVFGPFAAKNDEDISYYNWGRYGGNPWYGRKAGAFNEAFPGNDGGTATAKARWGMTYMPEYFGEDFRMFFIDDPKVDVTNDVTTTAKNVMIIQGVNILGSEDKHSVIYSRRGVELGGGLEKSLSQSTSSDSRGFTTRGVNSGVYGMSYGKAPRYPNYYAITTRYSQIIYNTDIVLRTPEGASTPRLSYIIDALLPSDGIYGKDNDFSDEYNKRWTPTVKIIGGHMFVGEGHRLHIEGGRLNTNSIAGVTKEKTLTVSPSSLTVESGGLVKISKSKYVTKSEYANVTTDISVNGELILADGAYAGGTIVVGNGGALTLADASRYDGNIYVESGGALTVGSSAVEGDVQIRNGGKATINEGASVTGGVRCAGELNITGDITINATEPAADNPNTVDINENRTESGKYIYHGIFIYGDSGPGAGKGTLKLTGAPRISGNAGKIHALAGDPGIAYDSGDNTFCDDRSDNNACQHWTSGSSVWIRYNDVSGVS